MADLVMVKRGALAKGEMGLFIDSEVFSEEFGSIKQGTDISVEAKQSRNLKQMRLAWALCRKIADSGALGDADTREVMNYLLKKAKHVKYIANQHRHGVEVEVIVKSIRFASMDQTAFDRLFRRMIWIVISEIIPDMQENALRAEVEHMSGVTTPEPEMKTVKQTRRRALPAPVSVIPADEPVNEAVNQGQSNPPASPPTDGAGTVSELPSDVAPPAPKASELAKPVPPSPAAIGGPAGPAPPNNVKTWHDWCFAWLKAMDDDPIVPDVAVLTKWASETKLRNQCGVTADDRQQLFSLMNKIVEKKRESQKAI